MSQRPNRHIPIILDTKGREIRTGLNKDGKQIKLVAGQILEITTDMNHMGDNTKIACTYKALP